MIINDILDAIGKTPIVKFNRVGSESKCNFYGKCEFLNAGGSVKDRIGKNMIEDAEKSGRIKPGVKGYKMIITMPEKMSREKENTLKALGAEIVRTPTEAAWDAPESHIGVAKKLQQEIKNSHILDQYSNNANPDAHYMNTAEEIINDMGESLSMVVAGVGTGGTITGVARKLKEYNSDILIVGADPYGSILGGGDEIYAYDVEGIGYDFFPDVLDNNLIDRYIKVNDKDSFTMARKIIKEEGLLVGGSSGTAVCAAVQAANDMDVAGDCLVILPDSIRNYMSKFIDDSWLNDNSYL